MALADITLNDGQGTPQAHTFTFVSSQNGKIVRSDLSRSPEIPLTMTHGHQTAVRKNVKTDSHLLRFDDAVLDADGVTAIVANIRIMADVPVSIYSDALADDFAAFIRNWASSANVRAWMRNSVG